MATDPNQLLGVLLGTVGQGQNIVNAAQNNALAQQGAQQNLALGQQQQQLQAQQIAANDQDAAQQQQYQNDISGWITNGADAKGLTGLLAKYPKQWQALQQSWKVKSADQAQADLRSYGSVFNALDNNSPQVALAELKQRRAAEAKAGVDTTELDQHIQEIESGNPQAMAAVKGWTRAQIAAASGALGDSSLAKSVGVDVDNDRVKSIGNKAFDTRTLQYIDQPEGGDPASTGATGGDGSTAGRRSMGWTPSTADGGDNKPEVVAAKIADMAKATGLDPNAPLTIDQARNLATAIARTEGGPGSLADKNNNPTNITDGKFAHSQPGYVGKGEGGRYAKFDTKEHGIQAAQALLGSYYARGQRSITDIVMGKPAAGSGGGAASGPSQTNLTQRFGKAPVGYRWKSDQTLEPIPGGPKDNKGGEDALNDDAVQASAEQYLAGDKSALQNVGRGTQGAIDLRKIKNRVAALAKARGMNGAQIAGQMADFTGLMAAERATGTRTAQVELPAAEAQRLIPLALKASDALPRNGFLPFSKAQQSIRNGVNNPQLRQFVTANTALVNVYSRAVSPTGTPTVSLQNHARELLDTAYDQKSYRAVVTQMQQEIAAARAAPASVRGELRGAVGGAPANNGFTHMSKSGAYGWNGTQWVKAR